MSYKIDELAYDKADLHKQCYGTLRFGAHTVSVLR